MKDTVLPELWEVIRDRISHPREGSYVAGLVTGKKGIDAALEKVGEEAAEFIIAVKNGEREATVSEAADLQFHLLVALAAAGIDLGEVLAELGKRRRQAGDGRRRVTSPSQGPAGSAGPHASSTRGRPRPPRR